MKPFTLTLLLTLLTACSAMKQAGVVYQTGFDFGQVNSYSMYERNSDFVEFQSINDVTRNGIEIAIEKSMEKKGFSYTELDQADVIVSYHLINQTQADISQYNKNVLYCSYCLRASNWQSEQKNWKLAPGNLIIDLVDPKTNRSVWRSVFPLDIDVEDNSRKVNGKIKSAISAMLALYPTTEPPVL